MSTLKQWYFYKKSAAVRSGIVLCLLLAPAVLFLAE